jgi:hypothetical protein
MSVIEKIAFFRGRRDEAPNQELAHELARTANQSAIAEIAENLWHKNAQVQSDCIKVLYEIGYRDPKLVDVYWADFLKLLRSRNNRLVWGAMIALSTIAESKADELFRLRVEIQKAISNGSVITVDSGIKTLAIVAGKEVSYRNELLPYLIHHLRTCRPKDVPQHAEHTLLAVDKVWKSEFIEVLKVRLDDLTQSQATRVKRVIANAQAR